MRRLLRYTRSVTCNNVVIVSTVVSVTMSLTSSQYSSMRSIRNIIESEIISHTTPPNSRLVSSFPISIVRYTTLG